MGDDFAVDGDLKQAEAEPLDDEGFDGFEGFAEEGTYISLTVRTLSGAEIQFPQLNLNMSVVELKQLIAEQNDKFPVDEQKLIKGANQLNDDNALGDYDLKNGDTIHLVKRLGETSREDEEDGVAGGAGVRIAKNTGANANQITVVVPDRAAAGTRLLINPPGRSSMSVTVPAGLRPGDRFTVRLPPSDAAAPTPRAPAAAGGAGTVMQVQCPPNARPGQQILIDVGGSRMRVQVPRGTAPGAMFRFRVPT